MCGGRNLEAGIVAAVEVKLAEVEEDTLLVVMEMIAVEEVRSTEHGLPAREVLQMAEAQTAVELHINVSNAQATQRKSKKHTAISILSLRS
jgi:hypothetical protein